MFPTYKEARKFQILESDLKIGTKIGNFEIIDIDGPFVLSSEMAGKAHRIWHASIIPNSQEVALSDMGFWTEK